MYFVSLMRWRDPSRPMFPSPLHISYGGAWELDSIMTELHPLDWIQAQDQQTIKLIWWAKDDRVDTSAVKCRLCLEGPDHLSKFHPHAPGCSVALKESERLRAELQAKLDAIPSEVRAGLNAAGERLSKKGGATPASARRRKARTNG